MKNIFLLAGTLMVFVCSCKKSGSVGTANTISSSTYYITCNINGTAKSLSNGAVCSYSDTVIAGQSMAIFFVQGSSSTLPAEGIQISILGIDISKIPKNTFVDTATSYGLTCNHFIAGIIDYATLPLAGDSAGTENPFQITITSISNGIASGTFKGNLYDTATGVKIDAVTDGKFNLVLKE